MKVKVSEASGIVLDWMVAKSLPDDTWRVYFDEDTGEKLCHDDWEIPEFSPSTDWAQGGPIIEREKLELRHANTGMYASYLKGPTWFGPTPLIAAMRCFCDSRLGETVEVPDDLT